MTKDCIHCATPFTATAPDDDFCCAGCEVVHALVLEEGFDRFYDLKGSTKLRPAKDRPFQPIETEWIDSVVAEAEVNDPPQSTTTLQLSGVTCVGCVWLIEKLFLRLPGALSASVDPTAGEAEFAWKTRSRALIDLAAELPRYGYALDALSTDRTSKRESARLLSRLGLSAAFALNTMAFTLPRYLGMDDTFEFAGLFDLVALISSTLTLLIGGTYFFQKAITALQHRTIHIDLPIALGLALAFIGSIIGWLAGKTDLFYFDFVATFTTLMLAGRYVHLVASERVSQHLQGQAAILTEVTLADGTTKATRSLEPGDRFSISPGRALPVSARLQSEPAEFSLAWMTGEPDPQLFPTGRVVPAGAIPLADDPVDLQAEELYADSMVTRLVESSKQTGPSEATSAFLRAYLIAIIIIGIGATIGWLALGHPPLAALQVAISIFVISCPCAIGVAIPLVERRATAAVSRLGVFIQQPRFWQQLSRIRHVALDKTGTLTLEHPEIRTTDALLALSPAEANTLRALTQGSVHPLDRTLRQQLSGCPSSKSGTRSENPKPTSQPGIGRTIDLDGHHWTLGKVTSRPTEHLACELTRDGKSVAIFEFEETLRPEASIALDSLRNRHHLDLHILSGDQQPRIDAIATALDIPTAQAHGNLTPDEKRAHTEALPHVLYLGDGMNDAPAFAASALTGTPVTDRSLLDRSASFLFTCRGLAFLPRLFQLARWTRHTITHIVGFTLVYNTAAITACILGHMTPLLAAILMPLSSLVSIGIALRPITSAATRRSNQLLETNEVQPPPHGQVEAL